MAVRLCEMCHFSPESPHGLEPERHAALRLDPTLPRGVIARVLQNQRHNNRFLLGRLRAVQRGLGGEVGCFGMRPPASANCASSRPPAQTGGAFSATSCASTRSASRSLSRQVDASIPPLSYVWTVSHPRTAVKQRQLRVRAGMGFLGDIVQTWSGLPDVQRNLAAAAFAGVGSLAWTKIWDKLALAGVIEQKLCRKIGASPAALCAPCCPWPC